MTALRTICVFITSAEIFLTSGCMHAFMGMDHSGDHEMTAGATFVKDTQRDSLIIRLSVPELSAGMTSSVVLTVLNSATSMPYHDVRLMAHWKLIDTIAVDNSGGHADYGASATNRSSPAVSEGSSMLTSQPKDGSISYAFTPPRSGRVQLHFTIVSLDGSETGSDVSAEVVQPVHTESSTHAGARMMRASPVTIVSMIGMGMIMAIMLMVRVF